MRLTELDPTPAHHTLNSCSTLRWQSMRRMPTRACSVFRRDFGKEQKVGTYSMKNHPIPLPGGSTGSSLSPSGFLPSIGHPAGPVYVIMSWLSSYESMVIVGSVISGSHHNVMFSDCAGELSGSGYPDACRMRVRKRGARTRFSRPSPLHRYESGLRLGLIVSSCSSLDV